MNVSGTYWERTIVYPSQGDCELAMLGTIERSGWRGPIGLIAEQGGDAEVTLSNAQRGLLPAHQTILYYTKTDAYTFNEMLTDYSPATNVDQILQRRSRDESTSCSMARHRPILDGRPPALP